IGKVATERAHMRPDTERLFDIRTTRGAFLRRVVRSHSNDLTPSTLSLGFKVLPEHPPRCIGYGKGQTMVADHVGHLQIFNGEDLIAIDIVAGCFMQRIFALVGNALMGTRYKVLRLFAPVATLLAFGQLALSMGQLASTFLGMFR